MSGERPLPGAANAHDPAEPRARDGRDRPATAEPLASTSAVRLAAVEDTSGTLTGTYDLGYLKALREDWPA